MVPIAFLLVLATGWAFAYRGVRAPVPRAIAEHFARRQALLVSAFTVDRILRHLHVRQRFMWAGTGIGTGFMLASLTTDSIGGGFYLPIIGWFFGVVMVESRFARSGGRIRRPIGASLVPPPLTLVWRAAAVIASAVALSAVLRSLWQEVTVAERLWAVGTLGVVLAVELLVMGLNRRELRAGPADLVAAEVAMRSNSARTLFAGGTIVALWIAPGSGLPALPDELTSIGGLLAFGLPILAVVKAMTPWRAHSRNPAAKRLAFARSWPVPASVLLAVGLVATFPYGEPPGEPRAVDGHFSGPARYASLETGEWRLYEGPGDGYRLSRARTLLPLGGAAPLALSGDGHHVVHLDDATGRLVMLDLPTDVTHELTDPLPRGAVPDPAISHDGRYVSLTTATGVELVDTRMSHRTKLPGIHRVLGLGPGGLVATTGRPALHGAPDTELLTLDHQGDARTRVPFDPTLRPQVSRDGRSLFIVTNDEVVTMDVRTGRVRERTRLRIPAHHDLPEPSGLAAKGRILIKIKPQDDETAAHHLLDPATGRTEPVKDVPADAVFGRWP